MKQLSIEDFVGAGDIREWMNSSFALDGREVATDGHSIVRLAGARDGSAPDANDTIAVRLRRILEVVDQTDCEPIPQIDLPPRDKCAACLGSGQCSITECLECEGEGSLTLSTAYHDYDVDCRSCGGAGEWIRRGDSDTCPQCNGAGAVWPWTARVRLPGVPFDLNPNLLSRIIGVKGMRIGVIRSGKMKDVAIAFKCPAGDGAIMGIRSVS